MVEDNRTCRRKSVNDGIAIVAKIAAMATTTINSMIVTPQMRPRLIEDLSRISASSFPGRIVHAGGIIGERQARSKLCPTTGTICRTNGGCGDLALVFTWIRTTGIFDFKK